MNGIDPRTTNPQRPPTVPSAALQQGADEILKLFFGKDKLPRSGAHERNVAKATTGVQTEDDPEKDARAQLEIRLEEETKKLQAAKERIAQLMADLQKKDVTIAELRAAEARRTQLETDIQKKDATIAELQDHNRELKDILGTLQHAPTAEVEDVVMLETRPDAYGEPDQSLDELTLVGDFVNADGEPLQFEDVATTLSPDPLSEGAFRLTDIDTLVSTTLAPQITDIAGQCSIDVGSQSDVDMKSDLPFDYDSDSDPEEDYFPYPEGCTPSVPLRRPTHIFIPATCKLQSIRIPASPLRPEEQGVGFDFDVNSSDDDSDADPE